LNIGIVKDYFVVTSKTIMYWCSSSTWVFSELPKLTEKAEDLEKLKTINNMFTGEFDSVLFPGSGKPEVVDAAANIVIQPKNITELDRLAYIISEIRQHCFCVPKNRIKYVPSGKLQLNEGFSGLSKEDAFNLDNWQFVHKPTDPEILGKISRGEQTYNSECLDPVSGAFPKNSWSI
jgi:hypothetical protein